MYSAEEWGMLQENKWNYFSHKIWKPANLPEIWARSAGGSENERFTWSLVRIYTQTAVICSCNRIIWTTSWIKFRSSYWKYGFRLKNTIGKQHNLRGIGAIPIEGNLQWSLFFVKSVHDHWELRGYHFLIPIFLSEFVRSTYNNFSRIGWALAVSWVIVANHLGWGGSCFFR